ncbi:MAG: hypothetical protein M3R63_16185 [Actinomycetota bacterium]|nr:hypothetical protein [Actinomycetota bacterium]
MAAAPVPPGIPGARCAGPPLRRASQRIADVLGLSFSAVVAQALTGWLRARLVDAWLAEHQAEQGTFDEGELQALAAEAGVPYLPPGRTEESAA